MKQRNFFEYKSNLVATYVFGLCVFIFCLASGYKLWLDRFPSAIHTDDIKNSSESVNNQQPESLSTEKFHPSFIISEGDTLGSLLNEANVDNSTSLDLVNALSKKLDPRKLNIGTVINLNFENNSTSIPSILNSMIVNINNRKSIEIKRNANGNFVAHEVVIPLVRKITHKSSIIKNSVINTALGLSVPSNAIMGMVRALSYDIDFQRDIKEGDKLEIIMENFYTEDGKLSHSGNILYSGLTLRNKKISIYQFARSNGEMSYYNENGENIKKEFLRTPINAAKISSKFGMRKHPVLGYTRMHKGIDFAAPTGTPILAAGTGVVEIANRQNGYGNYIRIKHNNTYSTAYAHASRFAKNIKPGTKVTQGQVIAYVGKTGMSKGPHLHYEVLEHGKQINPLKFKFASNSEKLVGKNLEEFKKSKKEIHKYL